MTVDHEPRLIRNMEAPMGIDDDQIRKTDSVVQDLSKIHDFVAGVTEVEALQPQTATVDINQSESRGMRRFLGRLGKRENITKASDVAAPNIEDSTISEQEQANLKDKLAKLRGVVYEYGIPTEVASGYLDVLESEYKKAGKSMYKATVVRDGVDFSRPGTEVSSSWLKDMGIDEILVDGGHRDLDITGKDPNSGADIRVSSSHTLPEYPKDSRYQVVVKFADGLTYQSWDHDNGRFSETDKMPQRDYRLITDLVDKILTTEATLAMGKDCLPVTGDVADLVVGEVLANPGLLEEERAMIFDRQGDNHKLNFLLSRSIGSVGRDELEGLILAAGDSEIAMSNGAALVHRILRVQVEAREVALPPLTDDLVDQYRKRCDEWEESIHKKLREELKEISPLGGTYDWSLLREQEGVMLRNDPQLAKAVIEYTVKTDDQRKTSLENSNNLDITYGAVQMYGLYQLAVENKKANARLDKMFNS